MPLDVGKLQATLTLDRGGFTRDVAKSKAEFRDLGKDAETAGRKTGRAFDDAGRDSSQAVEKSTSRMSSAIKSTEQDAQKAKSGITSAFKQAGADGAKGLTDGLSSAKGAIGEAGGGMGGEFIAGFAPRIAQLGAAGGPVGIALAGVAALGTVAIGAGKLLADNVMQGFELRARQGEVKAQFGFTDRQMAEVGRAAGGAFGNAWGESVNENMRTAGLAMQTGLLGGNATAAEIQPIVEKLSIVSKMGLDVQETARAAGQMLKTGLARNGAEAMDLLVTATQRGLNINGDLLDTLNEYGTQFRKIGLNGQTALGLVSQAMDGGARDADVAADALKEFSIRVVDGSKSTQGAFTELGLNVEATEQAFGKGGESARNMSDTVIKSLAAIEDPVKRNQIGVALFGTQWEDMGAAINNMNLDTAAAELGDVAGAAKRAGDDMGGGAASFQAAKNQISMSIDDMKMRMSDAFAPMAGDLANWVSTHSTEIQNFFIQAARYSAQFGAAMLTAGGYVTGFVAKLMWVGAGIADFIIKPIGQALQAVGGFASHLPGVLGENGRAMKAAGDQAVALGDNMRNASGALDKTAQFLGMAGDKAMDLAGKIQAIPPAKEIRVGDPGGQEVLDRLRAMGVQVTQNNDKTISAAIPQGDPVLQKLREIGIEVQQRNGKTILVKADDGEYQKKKRVWLERETKWIDVRVADGTYGAGLGVLKRASGGPVVGPGGPREDRVPMLASNGEYVHQTSAVDYYGIPFMDAINARQIPRDAIRRANGGLVTDAEMATMGGGTVNASLWKYVKAKNPGAILTSAKTNHDDDGGLHPQGKAIDIDPSEVSAKALWDIRDQLAMIIWGGAGGKYNFYNRGGTRAEGDAAIPIYGSDVVFGQHANHIHAGAENAVTALTPGAAAPGVSTVPLIQNPDGTWTSPSPAWAALIKRESGGNMKIVQQIQDVNSGGNEASGGFQIAKGTWANYGGREFAPTAGEATPQQQAIVAARIFNKEGGRPWGAGLPGREDEGGLRAGLTTTAPAAVPTTGGDTLATDSATTDTTATTTSGPPEDPNVVTLNFKNPFEPWWWRGEREYNERIIADYEKRKKWDEYWTGDKTGKGEKGASASSLAGAANSISEKERAVSEAEGKLKIAKMKLSETNGNPKAKASAKESARQSVDRAQGDVDKAKADLEVARMKQKELQAKGTLPTTRGNKNARDKKGEKGATGSQLATAGNSIDEKRRAISEARDRQKVAKMKLDEVNANPKAKASAKESARQAVTRAESAVQKAEADLRVAEMKQKELQSKGARRAAGGPISGPGGPKSDIIPMWASNGEYVQQAAAVDYYGQPFMDAINARAIPRDALRRAGGGPVGGFGGYTDDTTDVMKPKNIGDWMGLASGTAFAAYNMAEPFISAGLTGNINLGSMTPTLNTGTTDTGMVSQAISGVGGQIQQQIGELIRAVKEGKDITVKIEGIQGGKTDDSWKVAAGAVGL